MAGPGLPPTYDLPGHRHMATIMARAPTALWDDGWYAGHPTYAYPPLAHALAAPLVRARGEDGLRLVVVAVVLATGPALYAAGRHYGGLDPTRAAAAAFATLLAPALWRALWFGQYPTLLAFVVFWATLAGCGALLRRPHHDLRLAVLVALGVGLLGSIHLLPLLAVPIALLPPALLLPWRRVLARLALPMAAGLLLALLPSLPLLLDLPRFTKTPVPHVTRSADLVRPAGWLTWVGAPAGLSMVLALPSVVLARMGWAGKAVGAAAGAAGVVALREVVPPLWLGLAAGWLLLLSLALRRSTLRTPAWAFALAALVGLWVSLGPAGGIGRLLPWAQVLVYDRFLLLTVPMGYVAVAHALGPVAPTIPRLVGAAVVAGVLLLGCSFGHTQALYRRLVAGALEEGAGGGGAAPRARGANVHLDGTSARLIPAALLARLQRERGWGRVLPLGTPPVVFTLPDVAGWPLIDGAYNDARQLAVLRRSGVEALAYEKFADPTLRLTRFFLRHARTYGIRWVVTQDRVYDPAVPRDRFELVLETGRGPFRSWRLYRAVHPPVAAWTGTPRRMVRTLAQAPLWSAVWHPGGGAREVEVRREAGVAAVTLAGTTAHGWTFVEVRPPTGACSHVAFTAWSPTAAGLAVRVRRDGTWLQVHPDEPLPLRPGRFRYALDCSRVDRLILGVAGSGLHQAYFSSPRFERETEAIQAVPFHREHAECFQVTLPSARATVTVSVAAVPRWRAADPAVRVGEDALGLLTLRGPAGRHRICLAFPWWARAVRVGAAPAYLLASGLLLLSAVGRPGGRRSRLTPRLRGPVTTLREIWRRHHLPARQAWDARAREAADWFTAWATGPEEAARTAEADLVDVLEGIDPDRLRTWRVLEIGCGTGRLLRPLAARAREVWGVDVSEVMVTLAAERLPDLPNVRVMANDGRTLAGIPDRSVDLVCSHLVFQHVPERAVVAGYLREAVRVLRPGGLVRFQVNGLGESRLWRALKSVIGEGNWFGVLFTRQELAALARAAGLDEVTCRYGSPRPGMRRLQSLWLWARAPVQARASIPAGPP